MDFLIEVSQLFFRKVISKERTQAQRIWVSPQYKNKRKDRGACWGATSGMICSCVPLLALHDVLPFLRLGFEPHPDPSETNAKTASDLPPFWTFELRFVAETVMTETVDGRRSPFPERRLQAVDPVRR